MIHLASHKTPIPPGGCNIRLFPFYENRFRNKVPLTPEINLKEDQKQIYLVPLEKLSLHLVPSCLAIRTSPQDAHQNHQHNRASDTGTS